MIELVSTIVIVLLLGSFTVIMVMGAWYDAYSTTAQRVMAVAVALFMVALLFCVVVDYIGWMGEW